MWNFENAKHGQIKYRGVTVEFCLNLGQTEQL